MNKINKEETNEFYVYLKDSENMFKIMNSKTNEIKTVHYDEFTELKDKYYVLKGYEATDKGITKYMNDLKEWTKELSHNKVLDIKVLKYEDLPKMLYCTFKRLCKGFYENHEPITHEEHKWFSKCYNSGLQYCKEGTHQSYGYDYSFFYLNILSTESFMIPSKAGKECHLKQLPSEYKEGFFRVKIISSNPNVKKIFSFSKDHVYHSRSIYHIQQYKEKYDITIELIQDDEPNAYLYDKNDLVSGNKIFRTIRNKMKGLKELFPKNKLIKYIASGLWGHLSRTKIITKKEDELKDMDVGVDYDSQYTIMDEYTNKKNETCYRLLCNSSAYKTNLRLKPFLTAFGRNKIARVALKDIDNVLRIHTDGIVFSKKHDELITDDFIIETKTTGMIEWTKGNNYKKV